MGVYVSATVIPHTAARAVYSMDWGCPSGGEPVAVIFGVLNPRFGEPGPWKGAVMEIMKRLQVRFQQTTVTVVFQQVEMEYLTM